MDYSQRKEMEKEQEEEYHCREGRGWVEETAVDNEDIDILRV